MNRKLIKVNHKVIDLVPFNQDEMPTPVMKASDVIKTDGDHIIELKVPLKELLAPERRIFEGVHVPGFEILDRLGIGGVGTVYHARNENPGVDRDEAIKFLRGSAIEQFKFESELTSKLKSKCGDVVEIFGYSSIGSTSYIRMNYFKNGDLKKFRLGNEMSMLQVVDMSLQMSNALEALHELGYVHRDLKPQNLFVSDHLNLRVGDFGAAVEIGTTPTQLAASPGWAAPEQMTDEFGPLGAYTDIFSMGCCIYFMIKEESPFPIIATNPEEAFYDHYKKVKSIKDVDFSDMHADLVKILKKALDPDPKQRYQSVSVLKDDLSILRNIMELKKNRNDIARISTRTNATMMQDKLYDLLDILNNAGISQDVQDKVVATMTAQDDQVIEEYVSHLINSSRLSSVGEGTNLSQD